MSGEAEIQIVKSGKVIDAVPLARLIRNKGGTLTFGRELDNDIRTDHPSCSRTHVALSWKENEFLVVKDLRSTHGSAVINTEGRTFSLLPNAPTRVIEGMTLALGASTRTYRFKNLKSLAEELQPSVDDDKNPTTTAADTTSDTTPLEKSTDAIAPAENPTLAADKAELQVRKPLKSAAVNEEPETISEDALEDVFRNLSNLSLGDSEKVRRTVSEPFPAPTSGKDSGESELEEGELVPDEAEATSQATQDVAESAVLAAPPPVPGAKHCMRPGLLRRQRAARERFWQLIVDTNVLLDPHSFLLFAKLVELRRARLVIVVVPRIVVKELDAMNHQRSRRTLSDPKGQQIRAVFRMLETEQLRKQVGGSQDSILHMQERDEPSLDDRSFQAECNREKHFQCNDDYILEAAHYFKKAAPSGWSKTSVLTNDRALRVRARSEDLLASSAAQQLPMLIHECKAEVSKQKGPKKRGHQPLAPTKR